MVFGLFKRKEYTSQIIACLMRAGRRRNFYRRGTFNDQQEKGFTFAIKRHRDGDNYRARARERARARARASTIVNARLLRHRYNFPSVIEGIKSAKFRKPRHWRES